MIGLIYKVGIGSVDRKVSSLSYLSDSSVCLAGESVVWAENDVDETAVYVDETLDPIEYREKQSYTLDTLPVPCALWIDDTKYEVTEQPTFAFEYPGDYQIRVVPQSVQYLEMEFTHHVD